MPWTVEKGHGCPADKPWAVVQADGTRMGCHATEDDAKKQQAALYAQEGRTMTTDVPANPLDGVPEVLRPLLPDWAGDLRDRAVPLADIEIVSRAKGGDGRTVVAYAAVFDSPAEVRDQDGHYLEQIHRAAFDQTIRQRAGKINVFYNHGKNLYGGPSDRFAVPIGTPVEIRAEIRGLRTTTQYNRTPLADEILEAIKAGSIRGMSFTGGFLRSDPDRGPYYARTDGGLVLVTRQEIALIEYGPTPIPNYEDADIVGVRAGELEEGAQRAVSDRPWSDFTEADYTPEQWRRACLIDTGQGDQDAKNRYKLPVREPSGALNRNAVHAAAGGHGVSAVTGVSPEVKQAAARKLVGLYRNQLNEDPPDGLLRMAGMSTSASQGRSDTSSTDDSTTSTTSTTSSDAATEDSAAHRTEPLDQTAPVPPEPDGTPAAEPREGSAEEPHTHSEVTGTTTTSPPSETTTTATSRSHSVDPDQTTLTAQERVIRQSEIRTRMAEIDAQYNGAVLPQETQDEWDQISKEYDEHTRAIAADTQRKQRLRLLVEQQERDGGGERVDNQRAGYGTTTLPHPPGFIKPPEDIYDLPGIRNRARSVDDLPALYRENAMRAVEVGRFGRYPGTTKEDMQGRIAQLLDTVDAGEGELARRILVTGSPIYERAFGKWLARGSLTGLTSEEQRALSMGSATSAQLAVPFTLDPTILLTSDGATNPLRAMSRVETITGRTWEGVTSAGITVSRSSEAAEASDNAPALAQPTLTPTRVVGFVPFSIEADQDWTQLRSEMTRLLADAKDVEEATSFVTGNGTAPNPGGIQATLTTASNVNDGNAFSASTIYSVENALPPRFTPRAQWLARKNFYNQVRAVDTNGTLYVRITAGRPNELLGYPANEASAMPYRQTLGTSRYAILGDFSNFLIVDKAGMDVELIPHLFHVSNNLPSGQRGLFAMWRNNSAILVPNAFRILFYAT